MKHTKHDQTHPSWAIILTHVMFVPHLEVCQPIAIQQAVPNHLGRVISLLRIAGYLTVKNVSKSLQNTLKHQNTSFFTRVPLRTIIKLLNLDQATGSSRTTWRVKDSQTGTEPPLAEVLFRLACQQQIPKDNI